MTNNLNVREAGQTCVKRKLAAGRGVRRGAAGYGEEKR